MRLTITGAEDFSRVARELKAAGRKDLRRELFHALQSSTKPARTEVRASMPDFLPDQYAAALGKDLSLTARGKGGSNPSVQLRAKGRRKRRLVGPLNRGALRHPLFGNRSHWFGQRVEPGWWSDPLQRQADQVRRRLVAAMREIANKVD